MFFKFETRVTLTMGLLVLLAGACSSAQRAQVHDVLDGVHAVCESTDPAVHLLLSKTDPDAGQADAATER